MAHTPTHPAPHRSPLPAPGARRRPITAGRAGVVAVVVSVALLGAFGLSRGHVNTGDTPGLVRGTRAALDCIADGHWHACGHAPGSRETTVGPFPILQYLPAAAMVEAGWSDPRILRALAVLSYVAFGATLALIVLAGRRLRPVWSPVLLVVAVTGPLLFYSTSSFGEMLSASLVLACIVACLGRRSPALIAALALMAGLGKETLPLFIVALGLVVGRHDDDGWLPPARVSGPLIAGALGALTVNGAFNLFRWGSWGNRGYLQPAFHVGPIRTVRNLWNLLVAPGGGLLWFWTSLSLLLLGLAALCLTCLGRRSRGMVAPLVVIGTFAALMVGLASWWSPFGWVAWGPRLTLPVLPALAVAAAHAGAARLAHGVQAVLSRWWAFAGISALVLLSAWPQAGAPWQGERLPRLLQLHDSTCPGKMVRFSAPYFDCMDHLAWRREHNQLVEASSGGGRVALMSQLVLLVGVALLMVEARRSATNDRPYELGSIAPL